MAAPEVGATVVVTVGGVLSTTTGYPDCDWAFEMLSDEVTVYAYEAWDFGLSAVTDPLWKPYVVPPNV